MPINNPYYPFYPNYPSYPVQQQSVQRKVDLVQGRAAAEVYAVESGQEVILVDMDNPFVYRKARGFDNALEPMEIYDLVKHEEVEEKIDLSGYVTADELNKKISTEIERKIKEEVDKRISEISFTPSTRRTKKGVSE